MRRLRRWIVVLGALGLVALPPAGAGTGRARGGRIPRGTSVLEVTVARPHRAPTTDLFFTNPAKIRHFASLIDVLKAVGPSALDCTAEADDPVVTFVFLAPPDRRVLARARQIVDPGARGAFCEPMTLAVKGHVQTPLLGGAGVVRAAQRRLGIRLPRG